MPTVMPTSITKQKVIAVEGMDEKNFFDALSEYLKLTEIQVIPMEGRSSLRDKLKSVCSISGFENVVSFGVVIDANSNHKTAFESVCDALANMGLAVPASPLLTIGANPQVTVMILPERNKNGMLEDLCLWAVASDPAILCVKRYFRCLAQKNLTTNNASKAKVHAFLSSRNRPDLRLGEAAKAGYLPFSNSTFDEVKTFLQMI